MGKIRTKTIGDELVEEEQKEKRKKQREQKTRKAETAGVEKVTNEPKEPVSPMASRDGPDEPKDKKAKKAKFAKTKKRSKTYLEKAMAVDKTKTYTLKEGLELLPKLSKSKFDETVELHINTKETGISATLILPHGTGKQTRVAVADDLVIAQVEKGKIDFDILLATPQMMPKLAKVAKILGPKGMMPNPKNGTISANPQELVKQYENGKMNIKTEAKNPIVHTSVGKVSFGENKLSENISTVIKAIGIGKITKITLKSTMSPAIKIAAS